VPKVPDINEPDLLREWRSAISSLVPRQLMGPMERQVELIQDVLERERRLQREVLGRVFGPVDAVFDLLEQSGAMLTQQAQALEEAARALEQTAALMKTQADLFERTIRAARQPADLARTVAGLEKRPRSRQGSSKKRSAS